MLTLKEPKNELMMKMFKGQQKRVLAIADEVMEIEELSEVVFFFLKSKFMIYRLNSKMLRVEAQSRLNL